MEPTKFLHNLRAIHKIQFILCGTHRNSTQSKWGPPNLNTLCGPTKIYLNLCWTLSNSTQFMSDPPNIHLIYVGPTKNQSSLLGSIEIRASLRRTHQHFYTRGLLKFHPMYVGPAKILLIYMGPTKISPYLHGDHQNFIQSMRAQKSFA